MTKESPRRTSAAAERLHAEQRLRDSEARLAADLAGMQRLHDLHARLAAEPDLHAALGAILAAACAVMGTDRGCVQLVSDDGERLDTVAMRGFGAGSPYLEHLMTAAARCPGRTRLMIEDVDAAPGLRTAGERDAARAEGIRATVCTPLVSRNGPVWGVLSNQFSRPHRPDDRDLKLLDLLAWTAADFVARHRADAALRASEERQAFLLKLSDALRPLATTADIRNVAMQVLGTHLGVTRAQYYDVDSSGECGESSGAFCNGPPPAESRVRFDSFGRHIRDALYTNRTVVFDDPLANPQLSEAERSRYTARRVRAVVGVPLLKNGKLVAILAVSHATARHWTPVEVGLVEETAERTWAAVERARSEAALRDSEERFRGFAENSADVLWIANPTGTRLEYLSPAFERTFGEGRALIMADLRRWADLVHPDDLRHAGSFMARAVAGEVAIARYRVVRPVDGRVLHLRDTGFPIRNAAGAITQVAGIVQDVTDMVRAGEALEAETERFRTLAEGIPQLVWRSTGDGLWTWASPQWLDYTGQTQQQSHGWGWLDALHPDDRDATVDAWHEARAHGRLDVECRVRRASDGAWRWHATRSVPLRAGAAPGEAEGRILEWLGTTTDIDELKRLQGGQQVMVAELQHRTRNLLAVVRSLARRSIPPSPARDEYDARLAALGRVQGFLSRSPRYTVPLAELVEAELAATGHGASDTLTVAGPAVELPGEGVQAMALALHELATNAVKYGALAQAEARLSVTWRIGGDGEAGGKTGGRLVLDWREQGVAMPDLPPERRGYGSELITRALPYQLQAETELTFTQDGLRCRIVLPGSAFAPG